MSDHMWTGEDFVSSNYLAVELVLAYDLNQLFQGLSGCKNSKLSLFS